MNRLDREQAAVIGAFTGICCGPFGDIQAYAESKLGRSIWTHEFATPGLREELERETREDFLALCATEEK